MRCLICGSQLTDYGNNPFPLCAEDDYESRCCDVCNTYVIKARIAATKQDKDIDIGDTVVIFYANASDSPRETLSDSGKFLAGVVESAYKSADKILYEGSWGNFILDSKTDQYVKI